MRLHYKNPTWVNSTQVEPGFTLGNLFRSVNRALDGVHSPNIPANRIRGKSLLSTDWENFPTNKNSLEFYQQSTLTSTFAIP